MTWLFALAALNVGGWLAIAFAARRDHVNEQRLLAGTDVGDWVSGSRR